MYKLRSLVLISLCAFTIKGVCSDMDSLQVKFQIGLTGGFSQNNSMAGDIYLGFVSPKISKKLEFNIGYNYFKNTTNFDNVKDLLYYSHGVFGEANCFLTSNIYTGARLSVNMNFVDKASQDIYVLFSTRNPPTYFSGLSGFGQIGYNQALGKVINLRLQGQIGLHNYRIATGALYFSNMDSPTTDSYTEEKQTKFLYDLSLGLNIKL